MSKPNLANKINRLDADVNKSVFIASEVVRSAFSFHPGMKILFSVKPVWEKSIRVGFRGTKHELTFDGFTDENIAKNDLLVPLTVPDLIYLSERRSVLSNNPIPIPSLEAINICDDKYVFDQTLREKGYGKFLPEIDRNLSYPYILKKKVSEYGIDCYIISNSDDEKVYRDMIGDPGFFCQQIIAGTTEFATHIIYKEGKIISSLNIKYVFDGTASIKGQNDYLFRKICSCPYLDLFAAILKSIGFEGLCCFNYKESGSQPYILEINPRFGGSLSAFFFSFVRRLN